MPRAKALPLLPSVSFELCAPLFVTKNPVPTDQQSQGNPPFILPIYNRKLQTQTHREGKIGQTSSQSTQKPSLQQPQQQRTTAAPYSELSFFFCSLSLEPVAVVFIVVGVAVRHPDRVEVEVVAVVPGRRILFFVLFTFFVFFVSVGRRGHGGSHKLFLRKGRGGAFIIYSFGHLGIYRYCAYLYVVSPLCWPGDRTNKLLRRMER